MANWHIDPAAGSSSYSGDSWALTLSGTDGQTYGTTKFTSATGGFTGMTGRYIRITSTVYRIEAVVSDTEVTLNTTITSGTGKSFWIGGAVVSYSNFNMNNFYTVGDVVRWAKTGGWSSAGSLTYTSQSASITMGSGRIAMVSDCEAAWTASPNITGSLDSGATYHKFGSYSVKFIVGSAFTTGKVAYYDFGAGNELDLSSFQGISLLAWMNSNWAASSLRIALCSDASGDTVVDSIPIQGAAVLNPGGFCSLQGMKSGGGNLGSSIRSIALYADVDPGTPTIYLDNIVAIKSYSDADHICHNCLVGQGNTISDMMWAILGFTAATTITLTEEWYGGTAGAVSSYKVEPGVWTGTVHYFIYTSAALKWGQEVLNSGGWNPSTDSQDGVTCWRCLSYNGTVETAFSTQNYGNIAIENFIFPQYLNVPRYRRCVRIENCGFTDTLRLGTSGLGFYASSYLDEGVNEYTQMKNVWFSGMYDYALSMPNSGIANDFDDGYRELYLENITVYSTNGILGGDFDRLYGKNIKVCNSHTNGGGFANIRWFHKALGEVEIVDLELKDNGGTAAALAMDSSIGTLRIWDLVASGNTQTFEVMNSRVMLYNPSISDATKYGTILHRGMYAEFKSGGVADTHSIVTFDGTITSEATVRHTASGIAWKFSPTNSAEMPIRHRLAQIAVEAGVAVTIAVWMRRDNTSINGRIRIPGGRLSGMTDADYTESITANANIWELIDVAFTPTETGVVDLWVEAWGGTTYSLYVDDLSVTV